MNTKALLTISCLFLGLLGLAGSFAPQEVLSWLGVPPAGVAPLLVQLLGAAAFGFAMVNWIARGSAIGGIYNRAVAVGNFAHFLIGALALAKGAMAGQAHVAIIVLAVVYGVFAIAFARVTMGSGLQKK